MDPVDLLKDLIAIPSVNPMGRDLSGPEFLEGRVSDYLEGVLRKLGVRYQRIEVAPSRANVIARFGRPGRPSFGRPTLGKARGAPNRYREFGSTEDLWEAGFLPVSSYRVLPSSEWSCPRCGERIVELHELRGALPCAGCGEKQEAA